jgi:hypothetical protein
MMIRASAVMLFIGGIMLWMMSKAVPLLALMMMDWIGIFMMCGAMFILLFMFGISQVGLQYDSIPAGTAIVNFIRRDGILVPLLGKRIFSGESFLEVPKVGLIEDLGKDTVLLWGKKKIRFGMENINYTPDPRFFNVTKELYSLGFDDSDDLYNVLNVNNMDATTDSKRKAYYLERMANIYWNMTHEKPRGATRLVLSFKRKPAKKVVFTPKKVEPVKKDFDDEERIRKIIDGRLK